MGDHLFNKVHVSDFLINVAISRQLRHSTDDELIFFFVFFVFVLVLVCCSCPSHGGHCVSSMSQ